MKKNTLLIIFGALIIGLILGYETVPSLFNGRMGYTGMMEGGSMAGNVDRHFIEQMIPHHEGAIAMARVALERSGRPEVLALARDIITAQEAEIESMHDWYHDWFDAEVPESAHGGMMHMDGMTGDLDALEDTAAVGFDREFVEQMIPHHEMAIMMAQMLLATTGRSEMRELAQNIIDSQSREIVLMRGWLASWGGQ